MNKVLFSPGITLQKRRINIALRIRFVVFLGVVGIYSLIWTFGSSNLNSSFPIRNGRKLLAIPNDILTTSVPLKLETHISESPSTIKGSHKDENETITISSSTNNCTRPAINEFPPDGFTRFQRKNGCIVIHVLLVCYCFWFLAVICDDYFVPAIEQMCLRLNMQEDIVGATFMAAATSSPELFINCVGTFITKGDIGVGTIVGSAVFNILAVPACCGLFAGQMITLDWWPVTRDSMMYCVAVLGLICTLYDGIVMWYEALFLVLAYFLYITALYWNDVMARKARKLISKVRRKSRVRPFRQVNEISPLLGTISEEKIIPSTSVDVGSLDVRKYDTNSPMTDSVCSVESDFADDPFNMRGSCALVYLLRWPITFLLWITVPDSRKHPSCRFVTFGMAVTWIGVISYIIAYLITIVGDTLNIPDSVMGLTILAAGMSVPEAVSSVIVTNQGHGQMGISNSIGSNTFDILLCLGVPWFVKAFFVPTIPGAHWVVLNSSGLTYSAFSLLTTLFGLYIAFAANKFRLDWKIGIACAVMYVGFLILASMIELNVFFNVNLPICEH
ncbi:sodium/potassium/calcium exchanger 4-like [Episyrphus balteatus]|uniref:sodium/potassium/calcium exchanger 4-like n=1 Tax=Episyrphus balteatus TaxID=286459 RepID=UPI00248680E8|nr:sodium/potassium/calcium exchanger 4-like [Episyrphus balteatus]